MKHVLILYVSKKYLNITTSKNMSNNNYGAIKRILMVSIIVDFQSKRDKENNSLSLFIQRMK